MCYIKNKFLWKKVKYLEVLILFLSVITPGVSISLYNIHPYMFLYILRDKAIESALICLVFPERFIQSYIGVSFLNNIYKIYDITSKIIQKIN